MRFSLVAAIRFAARRSRDRIPAEELAERIEPESATAVRQSDAVLVQRDIGRGRVIMLTSGFFSDWNDMPSKNAVWLVDRILRSRIESTLPSATSIRRPLR